MTDGGRDRVSGADLERAGTGFLARWAVVVETEASPSDIGADGRPLQETVLRWFEEARQVYLEGCPALREEIRCHHVRLLVDDVRIVPTGPIEPRQTILIAVTVTELRRSSFDMALRLRSLGDTGMIVAGGSCVLVIVDPKCHTPLTLSDGVRHDVLALESEASDYC